MAVFNTSVDMILGYSTDAARDFPYGPLVSHNLAIAAYAVFMYKFNTCLGCFLGPRSSKVT